jgi:hypothetical protein
MAGEAGHPALGAAVNLGCVPSHSFLMWCLPASHTALSLLRRASISFVLYIFYLYYRVCCFRKYIELSKPLPSPFRSWLASIPEYRAAFLSTGGPSQPYTWLVQTPVLSKNGPITNISHPPPVIPEQPLLSHSSISYCTIIYGTRELIFVVC